MIYLHHYRVRVTFDIPNSNPERHGRTIRGGSLINAYWNARDPFSDLASAYLAYIRRHEELRRDLEQLDP